MVRELIEFVKQSNNVFDLNQIHMNALFLKKMMEKRGIQTEILEGADSRPYVYGEIGNNPNVKTILFYGHFDGVPVEKLEWHSNPYEPVFRDRLPSGEGDDWSYIEWGNEEALNEQWRIFGRSVADSKNAIVALMLALDYLENIGEKPMVNVKFLFDGEEEMESPSLPTLLQNYKEKLNCDLVISASGETHQSGLSTVELGIRGMLQVDLHVYSMLTDLHSGHFGNFAPNAVLKIVHLLSTMKNDAGMITVNGFYNEAISLTESEMNKIEKIPRIEEKIKQQYAIAQPEVKGKTIQELINVPTLNIRGITGGYVGNSARNIIPSRASAELDIRLIKGMDPKRTFERVVQHIQNEGWKVIHQEPSEQELLTHPKIVKIVQKGSFPATKTSIDSREAEYVMEAVRNVAGEKMVVMPTDGGSLALYLFEKLGAKVIGLPTSNYDCNQHTHDENLKLSYFFLSIEIFASLFQQELGAR